MKSTTEEKKKASLYSDLTWYYANVSRDSALVYGKKALSLSEKIKDSVILAQVYSDLGAVYFRDSDFKKSEESFLKCYQIRKKRKDEAGLAKVNNNLANVYKDTFKTKKAVEKYLEALQYFEKVNDLINVNVIKGNMGSLFADLNDPQKSMKYLSEAISFFESKNMQDRLCENYVNIGRAYRLNKNFKKAEYYVNKSIEACGAVKNVKALGVAYHNLSKINESLSKDSLAKDNLEKSTDIKREYNSKLDLAGNDITLAKQYIQKGNLDDAKKVLKKSIKTFSEAKQYGDEGIAHEELFKIFTIEKKPDSALYHYSLYKNLQNKGLDVAVIGQTKELEAKYQTAKKDNEILTQKSKVFKRNVAVFSLLGLLLVGFIYYKNYQNKQKIKLQKTILHQQDLATKAVMNAEDNERKRMASHLHDGVAQLLVAANMNVCALEDYKDNQDAFTKILDKTKNILEEAIIDVRGLSHQIMPNMLIKTSLGNALRDLIEKSTSPKLHIHLKLEDLKDNLDQNIQVVLYRIIQECINNTSKHANASEINILVRQTSSHVQTVFSDNGVGFNPLKVSSKSSGLGLENIKSRIAMMKGELNIKSEEGKGTVIKVEIPV